jgi:hypothetical protein
MDLTQHFGIFRRYDFSQGAAHRGMFSPDGFAGLLMVLGGSLWFVIWLFGLDFLGGTSSYWKAEDQDITFNLAGLNMYLSSPWQFPLLGFDRLNHPAGTNVLFADVIPLLAFLLKVLRVKGEDGGLINPFGYWIALCFLLQGVGAWWIAKELRVRSWSLLFALLVILLHFPALMMRLGHTALMSHWIILFAFCLYLRGCQKNRLPLAGWSILLCVSFYIHVYLFVMAATIYLGALGYLRPGFRGILRAGLPFYIVFASLFVFLFPVPHAVVKEGGFGVYSMNLLAPIYGGGPEILPTLKSGILQINAPVAPGQYEGVNYLGFGVIVCACLALFLMDRNARAALRRHWALLLILIAFFVYSLSDKIYFSNVLIATLNYPGFTKSFTSQFRASGRFFWATGYAIAIFSVFFVWHKYQARRFLSGFVILALAALQIADVRFHRRTMQERAGRDFIPVLDYGRLDTLLGKEVRTLHFYPKFRCGNMSALLPVMRYAASRGFSLNTGHIPRYAPECGGVQAEIEASDINASAYFFAIDDFETEHTKALLQALEEKKIRLACHTDALVAICRAGNDPES